MIHTGGILPARVLSRVESSTHETSQATAQHIHTVTRAPASSAYVMLAKFSNEPLTIPKATVLGVAEGISESLVDRINAGQASPNSPTKPPRKRKNEALHHTLLQGKLEHLPQ